MSEPFDLDSVVNESSEPFTFTWGGETFELPALMDRDIEEQLQLIGMVEGMDEREPAQILEVMRLIVGSGILARMRELRPVTARAVMTLISAWMEHQGEALGKSAASTPSSVATAARSKRTSRSARGRRTS